ncbi:MAG: ATP-binding cassette domain-containing protein [Pseudonocardia sp.]|nr:ATP-binding cassette domain-containing protein [Pseudonocardia sp.]
MTLTVNGLSLRYKHRGPWAVNNVDWSLRRGEHVMLLGPNGAGKSSLMRVLSGVTSASSGRITVDDVRVVGPEVRRRTASVRRLRREVAWMPQAIKAIPRLSVVDQVTYAGWLAGMRESQARTAAFPALDRVDLSEKAHDRADTLSGGQLRRLGLAESLVRGSTYLLLDEPTAGLDPAQRNRFRGILGNLDDKAVVVSTHETHDIAALFSRITVLVDGAIKHDGALSDFTSTGSGRNVSVEEAFTNLVGDR